MPKLVRQPCSKCGKTTCDFTAVAFTWLHGMNLCCGCIEDSKRVRVCRPCDIEGYEPYGGK